MRVVSTFLKDAPEGIVGGRAAIVMAFDTLVGEKSLVVGITVGVLDGPDIDQVKVSPIGQAVIDRCCAHHAMNYPHGDVVVAGVATVTGAKQRVGQVLAKAAPQALVLLVCADGKVYDAAFKALGVDLKSANANMQ